ncbi:hypothetical protein ACLB2K_053220 [Fragaria x ananassa]
MEEIEDFVRALPDFARDLPRTSTPVTAQGTSVAGITYSYKLVIHIKTDSPSPTYLHQFTCTKPNLSRTFNHVDKAGAGEVVEAGSEYEEQRLVVVGPDPVGDASSGSVNRGAPP